MPISPAPLSHCTQEEYSCDQSWQHALGEELHKSYFVRLQQFLESERSAHQIFPPKSETFAALAATPLDRLSVVILGQDPYHAEGQAHGLAFSVRPSVKLPPTLRNIFVELRDDLGCPIPNHGCLESWAKQGVLLLNTVLTVRAGSAASHHKHGWETFTDRVIAAVNDKTDPVVFILWGTPAQKKASLIDTERHVIIQSVHPSPLSAWNGFFGSRPFSRANEALKGFGKQEVDWGIPSCDTTVVGVP